MTICDIGGDQRNLVSRRYQRFRGLFGQTWAVASHEFGAAVRHLRESTAPAAVGLPVGRRRVRGLRREELGELAGMSADHVCRFEQGRSHPSAGVVKAIARALRVGRAEYERLCALAGYAAADGQVPVVSSSLRLTRPIIRRFSSPA